MKQRTYCLARHFRTGALFVGVACSTFMNPVGPWLLGCSDTSDTTTGKRLTHQTQVTNPDGPNFVTGMGWEVKLSKFYVSIGGVYVFDGAPIVLAGRSPSPKPAATPSFIQTAWAHPGHYAAGTAKADMTQATSVDLLAAAQILGTATGVSGIYRSATMYFGQGTPQGPLAKDLGTAFVLAEGTAKKGMDEKAFRFEVTEADLNNSVGTAGIDGCRFDEADVQNNGTIVLSIGVKQMFEQVEFETADPLVKNSRAFRGFVFGLRGGAPYRFSFKP
jgi:hypothetical protein